ncbi:MAG: hypothetical protein WAU36_00815 [Cyclobacteriaceae bacterium]
MKKAILFISIIALGACSTLKILKSENSALIAFTATTSYFGGMGKGMVITIRNVETGESYVSNSLSHFSSHCIVQNIKPGKYQVEKIVLNTGNNKFSNWSSSVRDYFGIIELEGNKKYYLGTFAGKVQLKFKNAISLKLEDHQIPEKIKSTLKEQGNGWGSGAFELIKTVSKKELIIY